MNMGVFWEYFGSDELTLVDGNGNKIDEESGDAYFSTVPREDQIGPQ